MKSHLLFAGFFALVTGLLTGCGEGAPKLGKADLGAFDSAKPELKLAWETALAAGKTNNYVTAITTLRALNHGGLTVEQIESVQNALRVFNTELAKAVERGDPAAQKTMEALQGGPRRRAP